MTKLQPSYACNNLHKHVCTLSFNCRCECFLFPKPEGSLSGSVAQNRLRIF